MSNYHEGGDPYTEGTHGGGRPDTGRTMGGPAHPGGPQVSGPQYDTSQFGAQGDQQRWEPQASYQGQGPAGQGFFQGGNPLGSRGRGNLRVSPTLKTTEFWVLVVVSVALLIAAAASDQGPDNLGGFGAHDAWKFVTWLAIAYIVSRGITKFAGHERDRRNDGDDRR
jgi:hypothetical protein